MNRQDIPQIKTLIYATLTYCFIFIDSLSQTVLYSTAHIFYKGHVLLTGSEGVVVYTADTEFIDAAKVTNRCGCCVSIASVAEKVDEGDYAPVLHTQIAVYGLLGTTFFFYGY